MDQGDDIQAQRLLEQARAIREKLFGPDHPFVAEILVRLGLVHLQRAEYALAEPLIQSALVIQDQSIGHSHPQVAETLDHLVVINLVQNRIPEAIAAASRAAEIRDKNVAAAISTGSEEQKRLYMDTLAKETAVNLSLHVQYAPQNPEATQLGLTCLLRRKGRVLDVMAESFAALHRSVDEEDQALLGRLNATFEQMSTRASRGPGTMPADEYRQELVELEQSRQSLEGRIGLHSGAFRGKQDIARLSDIQAKLPTQAALVEIARYQPLSIGKDVPAKPLRYVAYVLHPKGEPTFVDLGEAAPIESAIDAFRAALSDFNLTHDPKPAARKLDRLLMMPIRKLLGETRWVFLSPDGPLHLVPFGALVDERNNYLVQNYLFTYLTTGRDLLRLGTDRPAARETPLVLANPAFDEKGTSNLPEGTHRGVRSMDMIMEPLLPLESTVEEAQTIVRLFPKTRVLLGANATEAAVKATHAPRILHLATHGFFLPEQAVPRQPGVEVTVAERNALLQRENPLLRSGIALAGFNRRQSGNDDGVLTALEAAGLDLDGTKLVVLSTCESGLGQASSGEGVYGLRRALTMSGSETQVMSLWQVDTGRTVEMMQAYYQRLQNGEGRGEAMRDVQLAMLANSDTENPNLWASFIVSGEWRTLDGQARLPEVGKVSPGMRGCACTQVGHELQSDAPWFVVALGGVIAVRRRSDRGKKLVKVRPPMIHSRN